MLQGLNFAVVMNKENKWVIQPWHIRACLRKYGYYCKDECITLPKEPIEGPDLSKEGKEFPVTITINNLEKAVLKCRIHHWSTDPSERLPYTAEYWNLPAEQLFTVPSTEANKE